MLEKAFALTFLLKGVFMKSNLRFSLVASVLALLVGISITEIAAQSPIGEVKRRMDAHNKTLSTLRAKVTMVKISSQVGTSDTTIGVAIYAKGKGRKPLVRIDWQKPEESLAVRDGKYVMYRPKLNIAYTGDSNKTPKGEKGSSALAFMSMSKAELDANYDVVLLSENATLSTGVKTFHMQLTPKNKTSYKNAEIWVDVDGMPQQTKIIEKNNDTTTVLLSNLEKNIKLEPSNFTIILPKGVKVEKT